MTPGTVLGSALLESACDEGTVEQLARAIGISRGALADLISGHEPKLRTLRAVVRYLGVSADDVSFRVLHHLGLTKDGHPKHPLYLRADTPLRRFDAEG